MNRSAFLRSAALIAGGSLFFRNSALAAFLPRPAGNIKMLRGDVGIFTEKGGTIGFHLDAAGISVIDAQFPDTAPHFIEEVKNMQAHGTFPFHILLNTHHHGDHTAGNIAFKGLVPHVLAHANAAANMKAVAEKAGRLDQQMLPDTTFDKEAKVKRDKETIRGYYFGAGHTNGDAVYHFEKANIAHVGDLVFNRRHPFVDRAYGASMLHWVDVLEAIGKKFDKDTLFIFGHAGDGYEVTGSRADVDAFRNYLQRVIEFAQGELRAGKTKEEFIKNTAVPGVTEWKGSGLERPLTAVWDELTEAKR
ncbi:MBL fold metallo-hydrolase [Flaviaesturariibacter flavus]|uniref:MBL fold metallo-hydrolase n=1 Tax=Flaviaesturariibacter flavus TaxID=2502780 RepID=A0A4R1B7F0_9BACT|nr:MBL fold metallo-hydrolase [Flaviaesturariibacter flavus]TCJ12458.1 MBL fold metallo-hydrolase [Flaviaesturariibacter flavus]